MSFKLKPENIWCVGRNYADHAKEMNAPIPKSPIIFLKSPGCINAGSKIELPVWSQQVDHEIEIALLIDESLNISHVTLALDLTARDAQELAKKAGQPWTLAKSFKGACPIGLWLSVLDIEDLESLQLSLKKNNSLVQAAGAADMIFKPKMLVEHIKQHFPLTPGDIILTGTPSGVGPMQSGDSLLGELRTTNRSLLTCHWDVI